MESCFYETIHETDLLHVRFELQDAPAFVFPAHWHEYVEILYLIRGQFSAIVQATEYQLNEGDLIIINSGDLHMTRSNTCTYLLLQISASQMRQYLPDFDTMRFDTIIPCSEQPAPLRALLSEMNEIRQNPSDSYQLLFTSRLYEFLYHLCRSYSHQIPSASLTGSQRDLQRVTHVMNWVKVHYPEPLSLETAADSWRSRRSISAGSLKVYRTDLSRISERCAHDAPVRRFTEFRRNDHGTDGEKRAVELQNFYAPSKAVWLYTSENALEPDTARINSFETYCSYTH